MLEIGSGLWLLSWELAGNDIARNIAIYWDPITDGIVTKGHTIHTLLNPYGLLSRGSLLSRVIENTTISAPGSSLRSFDDA